MPVIPLPTRVRHFVAASRLLALAYRRLCNKICGIRQPELKVLARATARHGESRALAEITVQVKPVLSIVSDKQKLKGLSLIHI